MGADHITIAEASYRRCCADAQFLHRFYERLLASDARIPPMFAETEFDRQARLLHHALSLLLIYAKRRNPAMLQRLAERHGSADLDVQPEFFGNWIECLVATAEHHDPEFTTEVADAWREAMQPGIDFMIEHR